MDSLYALSCLLPFGFTSSFQFYDHYYIIAAYIMLYPLYSTPPVSYSYLIIPWVFPAWHHLLYNYLLLYACALDTVFNACLLFSFIDTRVLIYARHLTFTLHSPGSPDSSGSSCPGLGAWSLWILPDADQSGAAEECISVDHPESYPSRPPARLLSFSSVNSWAPFVLFILVHPLYSRICAILVM